MVLVLQLEARHQKCRISFLAFDQFLFVQASLRKEGEGKKRRQRRREEEGGEGGKRSIYVSLYLLTVDTKTF